MKYGQLLAGIVVGWVIARRSLLWWIVTTDVNRLRCWRRGYHHLEIKYFGKEWAQEICRVCRAHRPVHGEWVTIPRPRLRDVL